MSIRFPRSILVGAVLCILSAPLAAQGLDIVWIIDRTNGMSGETAALRNEYLNLIDQFQNEPCVSEATLRQGLVVFDETPEVILDLTDDVLAFEAALHTYPPSAGVLENGALAISAAAGLALDPLSPTHFILLTDEPGDWTAPEAQAAVDALILQEATLWVVYCDPALFEIDPTYAQIQIQAGSVDPGGDPLIFEGEGAAVTQGVEGALSSLAGSVPCPYDPLLTVFLGTLLPDQTAEFSLVLTDTSGRTTLIEQTWMTTEFDLGALLPGAVVGHAFRTDNAGLDVSLELVVATALPEEAILDLVVTSLSVPMLDLITSLGGTDPTGTAVGSLVLTGAQPPGVPEPLLTLADPDPIPPGATWNPTQPWELELHVTTPVVVLPPAMSTVTVNSSLTSAIGEVATTTQSIPIGMPSPEYSPDVIHTLSSTTAGAAALFEQMVIDPAGDRVTIVIGTTFDGGSFDLSGYAPGGVCGNGTIDLVVPNAFVGDFVVTAVSPPTMVADLVITSVDPNILSLLLSQGIPDPTGSAVMTIEYENPAGGGCTIVVGDQLLFPTGTPVFIPGEVVTTLDHTVPLILPGPGDLTVDTALMSQLGEFAFFTEVIAITGGGGGLFERANCNADPNFDIGDPIYFLDVLFGGGSTVPVCESACDSNDDGGLDIADAVYSLAALFSGGAAPPPPFGSCGVDPTPDTLGCAAFPPCP